MPFGSGTSQLKHDFRKFRYPVKTVVLVTKQDISKLVTYNDIVAIEITSNIENIVQKVLIADSIF
jgi:hypothetical protein